MTACCVWNAANAAGGGGGIPPITVSLSSANVFRNGDVVTVYANLQYNLSGVEYENTGTGNNFSSSRGNWLDSGNSEDAWLERTINSGSLYTDPGGGRLQLDTTRSFRVRDTNPAAGGVSCDLDIDVYNQPSGGSPEDSANVVLTATLFDACPTCCFTPDTLITMGDGSTQPISEVATGDSIRTYGGTTEVTEVIVRVNRPMWRLELEDGRILHLSDEHPIYIKGKGYSCIRPNELDYKDLKGVDKIALGDYAMLESGVLLRVVKMDPHPFTGKVYTFGNSRFYANGILVY